MAPNKVVTHYSLLATRYSREGFTLVEIIVVLGITALLSSIMISYNYVSRQQLALYSEQMKFVETIFRAKSLALSPYTQSSGGDICGYGIHVDYEAKNYSLFNYNKPQGTTCQGINSIDINSENIISTVEIDKNVKFMNSQNGTARYDDFLFISPDPITLVSSDGTTINNGSVSVTVQTQDGSLSADISVNSAGLINF